MTIWLVGKELRQHARLIVLGPVVLMAIFITLLRIPKFSLAAGSEIAIAKLVIVGPASLFAIFLGSELVIREFRSRTFRFLSGLPVSRWKLLAAKWLVGAAAAVVAGIPVLAVAMWLDRHSAGLSPRYGALLVAKSTAWLLMTWSCAFAFSFLGRYRWLTVLLAFVIFVAVTMTSPAAFSPWGPFELMGNRFAFERNVVPWEEFAETILVAVAATVFGLSLGMVGGSSVASRLAERMSSRERFICWVFGFFVFLISMSFLAREKPWENEPNTVPGAWVVPDAGVEVQAAWANDEPSDRQTARFRESARQVAAEIGREMEWLRFERPMRFVLIHRSDFKAGHSETERAKPRTVFVRANFLKATAGNHHGRLATEAVGEALILNSGSRILRENRRWVLDGYREYRGSRSGKARELELPRRPVSVEDLKRWKGAVDEVGRGHLSRMVAEGFREFENRHGEDALRAFLHESLTSHYSEDGIGWWRDVTRPIPRRLQKSTGISWDEFLDCMNPGVPGP